ncbi:hypothetical protein [Alicyclobacillus pomorum]|jgi:hypothetical protein|nr:hypothetical protein [Alicyclobacillus pomorum]
MKKALSVLTVCISLFVGTASAFASPLELPGFHEDAIHTIVAQ